MDSVLLLACFVASIYAAFQLGRSYQSKRKSKHKSDLFLDLFERLGYDENTKINGYVFVAFFVFLAIALFMIGGW